MQLPVVLARTQPSLSVIVVSHCVTIFQTLLITVKIFEFPFGGLETTYDDHPRLVGKRVVDFLLVLIELFFDSCYG